MNLTTETVKYYHCSLRSPPGRGWGWVLFPTFTGKFWIGVQALSYMLLQRPNRLFNRLRTQTTGFLSSSS